MPITRQTTINEIAEKYLAAVEELFDYGLHCIGCHASSFETIEDGFRVHGLDEKEIDEAIKKINAKIKEHK